MFAIVKQYCYMIVRFCLEMMPVTPAVRSFVRLTRRGPPRSVRAVHAAMAQGAISPGPKETQSEACPLQYHGFGLALCLSDPASRDGLAGGVEGRRILSFAMIRWIHLKSGPK